MAKDTSAQEPVWPLRTWVLAGGGALVALAIQQLVDLHDSGWEWGPRLVSAAGLFLGISGLAFALAWQRGRHVPAIIVALVCGVVSGGVTIWNGMPGGGRFMGWQMFCALVGSGFILTLFQAAQERHPHLPGRWTMAGIVAWKREALDYGEVHRAIWIDALLIGAALAFTGITFLVVSMLSEMFWLIKIDLLRELLRKHWFVALLMGAAFGGAIGILRDRSVIVGALQKVAMIVLRVLAPVLAVGLVLFLVALLFTGLAPLWATGSTTALMLGGAIAALFLVNAVIGERQEGDPPARVLRWGAMALGLTLLPLVLIAAWSTGLRIGQYGFTPDRLWALTFIILGTITAIAYAVAILRRGDWIGRLYRSNLHLAFILGGVAILLSTSLIGFERIATADQIARLESGRTKPVDFDYRGLWFDFGPPGRAAIKRLATEAKDAEVRKFAATAQKLESRFDDAPNEIARRSGDELDNRLTILPAKVPLDESLRKRLTDYDACRSGGRCTLRYVPGDDFAIVVREPDTDCKDCLPDISVLRRNPTGDWGDSNALQARVQSDSANGKLLARAKARAAAVQAGKVEVREVRMRQLFIDGEPFGDPIPLENVSEP